jgi:glycosyltransferase involved in cell wall biosynthesis
VKIAINTRFLLKNKLEGIGWYTYEISKRMVQNHPEVEFIFLFDRPFDRSFIFGPNVRPLIIPPPARHPWLFYLWFEKSLPYILKKYTPDVFFSPDNFCSLNYKGRTVLTIHDLAYRHFPEQLPGRDFRYYRKNMPLFAERADEIIAISEATKNDIIDLCGPHVEQKITIIHNGVRESFLPLDDEQKYEARKKYSRGYPYLLYIGAIHPRKNVKRIIEAFTAFKAIQSTPLKLIICGRFAWKSDEVLSAISASPVKDDIIHYSNFDGDLLPELTGGAEILLYPSLFEGFGLPVLEGFASGVPVITSNVSSLPEVAGDAAVMVDPFDVNALTSAIKDVYFDVHLQRKMRIMGLERVRQFTWQKASEQVFNVLTGA